MFIMTTKLTKKKLVAAVVVCGLLLCAVVLLVANRATSAPQETSSIAPPAQKMKTNEDRLSYLASLGWETEKEPTESQEVRIPETFDDTLTTYNQLQLENGFDLSPYKGKRVMRYAYEILNHSSGQNGVQAQLLVYKDKIIGGDIHTNDKDGFMRGLTKADPSNPCTCPPGSQSCPIGCTCTDCGHPPSGTSQMTGAGVETPLEESIPVVQEYTGAFDENQEFEDDVLPADAPALSDVSDADLK